MPYYEVSFWAPVSVRYVVRCDNEDQARMLSGDVVEKQFGDVDLGGVEDHDIEGVVKLDGPPQPDDEWMVEGNYGSGWEPVVYCETYAEALDMLSQYRDNEPTYPHRIRRDDLP